MYLSNIEIVGFKSFAQKTDFKFSPGLSALVGPNGCGKTNIVDAVRWVLGEKRASVLRSDVMENVIFNGTSNRKPMGMAEVTLILQNNKQLLPSEYNEISITRRLYRSGESQYLMNKTQCRLKDILNLFMDTGLGSDSYSVIELKMVEAILSGRIEDRRAMFEEAAGIKKYKIRRKESLRRLDQIQQDLDRVRDILEEVRKNVNSLSRQAAKTRRYNKLMDELKTLESKLLKQEFFILNKEFKEIEVEINEIEKQKIKSEIEISKKSESAEQLKLLLKETEHQFRLSQEKASNLKSRIAANSQTLAVSQEKLAASDSNIQRIDNEIITANQNIEELIARKNEAESKFDEVVNRIKIISEEYHIRLNEKEESLKIVKSIRANVDESNENVINIQSELNSLVAAKKRSDVKKSNIGSKLQQTEEEKITISNTTDELNFLLKEEKNKLPDFDDKINKTNTTLNQSLEKRASLQAALDNRRNFLNDLKNKLSGKKASLNFLQGIVHSNETSKFLLNNKLWRDGKETLLLGERIGADEKYRVAIESVLGEAANIIITDSIEETEDALKLLAEAKKGKATFVNLSDVELQNPENLSLNGNEYESIYDIIRADDKLTSILYAILGNTVVTSNYEDAKRIVLNESVDRAVSLNGEVVTKYGTVKGGSTSDNEGVLVGKKERIDIISNEISTLNKDIAESQKEIEDLNAEYQAIDINSIQNELKSLERDKIQNEQKISKVNLKIESLENKMTLTEENSIRYSDELQELLADESSNDTRISELESSLALAREELQSLRIELAKAEEVLKSAENEARESELNSVKLNSEQSSISKNIRSMEIRIGELQNIIEQKTQEINRIKVEKDALSDKIDNMAAELIELESKVDDAKNEVDYIAGNKEEFSEKYDIAYKDIQEIRKVYDDLNNQFHKKDLLLNERKLQLKNITNRLMENYEVNPEEVDISIDEEFDIDSSKTEVAGIRENLSSIGNINFMALEEYEEQSTRLEFYDKQLQDLEESEVTLKETIHQINTEAEKRFGDTFTKIQKNFIQLFKQLFGDEGYADLKLGEGNPLEANIEIIAKPPYKKPHSIEMLSGGEKTLTAIALLFAIYLVKPSPFCILDEVDAPLDDENIGKYVNLIKDFSIETQFLIVTHNKKTMEAADTLYGITMQENGVSKVVSVRFGEKEN